jgi:hypothetical protein
MSAFDFYYWANQFANEELDGPVVQVEIGLPEALEDFCVTNNIPVPPSISGFALIDKGASATAAHEGSLLSLGLQPIDSIPMHTLFGDRRSFVYSAKVSFPGMDLKSIPLSRLVGCNLNMGTKDGKAVIMLLGGDMVKYLPLS